MERLRLKLLQIGWEEKALALDWAELLEAVAEVALVTERAETMVKETLPAYGDSLRLGSVSDAVRLRDQELEERRQDREYEERARVADHALERKMDMEASRMDFELTKLEMSRAEPQRQAGTDRSFGIDRWMARGPPRQDTFVGRTKIFGDAMHHVLPQMPSESAEMPHFFETVEKLFVMYDVPDDIKSKLLIQHRQKHL